MNNIDNIYIVARLTEDGKILYIYEDMAYTDIRDANEFIENVSWKDDNLYDLHVVCTGGGPIGISNKGKVNLTSRIAHVSDGTIIKAICMDVYHGCTEEKP